jgi:hypothetical protein
MEGLGVALCEPPDRGMPMCKLVLKCRRRSRGETGESEFDRASLISAGVRTKRRRAREEV